MVCSVLPESESPVFTLDRMYYRSCSTVYTVPYYLQYRILCSEGSSFGLEIRCSYIVASDIASVASRIIMQTLRRRGSFIRRSVGRLHIGPKCPNLFRFWSLDLLEAIQGITFQCKKKMFCSTYSILVYFIMFPFQVLTCLRIVSIRIILNLNKFKHVWTCWNMSKIVQVQYDMNWYNS